MLELTGIFLEIRNNLPNEDWVSCALQYLFDKKDLIILMFDLSKRVEYNVHILFLLNNNLDVFIETEILQIYFPRWRTTDGILTESNDDWIQQQIAYKKKLDGLSSKNTQTDIYDIERLTDPKYIILKDTVFHNNEIAVLWKLKHHPNILVPYAIERQTEKRVHYYLPKCQMTLFDLISRTIVKTRFGYRQLLGYDVNFKEQVSRFIIKEILKGIYALHDIGYVHRDIKPENIFVNVDKTKLPLTMKQDWLLLLKTQTVLSNWSVYVGDFGLVQKIGVKKFCGSESYVAPEIWKEEKSYVSEFSADIWPVGCIATELYSQQITFENKEDLTKFLGCTSKWFENKKIPQDENLRDFIQKCLQVDPKQRISAVDALKHKWLNKDA